MTTTMQSPRLTGRESSSWGPGPRWGPFVLPLLVIITLVVMTALAVSGSSIEQVLGPERRGESVSLGASRSIRSDEWNVRSPLVAGQVERGLPDKANVGIGEHDMSVLYDLPTADPATLLRPNLWGYWILPLDHAFALDWWMLSAILVLGIYTLILVLTRDWRWAMVAAVVVYASPFFHWWYLGISLALVGWAALGTGLFLYSLQANVAWKRWTSTIFAGGAFAAFVTTAYPPFQIPVVIALGAVSVGFIARGAQMGQIRLRPAVVNTAVVGAIVGLASAAYLLSNADALSAINNSLYPGSRRTASGNGTVELLGTAWYGWLYVREYDAMGSILQNASEASSFLTLGVFLLAALPLVWRNVAGPESPFRWPIITSVTALVALLIHAYVGLPGIASRILLLDRAAPNRTIVGIGLASLVLLALVGVALTRDPPARWRRLVAGGILASTVVVFVIGFGQTLRQNGAPLDRTGIIITAAIAFAVAGLWFWRPLVSLAAMAVVGLIVTLPVNPLQLGLAPLSPDPLVEDLRAASEGDSPTWLSTDFMVSTILTANGFNNLGGVNVYPNVEAWRLLDPLNQYEEVWNRYAHTSWGLTASTEGAVFEVLTADSIAISINPCDPGLLALGLTNLATTTPLEAPCATFDRMTTAANGTPIFLYDVTG